MGHCEFLTGLNLLDSHLSMALFDSSSSPLTSESPEYFARFTSLLCNIFVVYMTSLYLMVVPTVWR